MTNKMLAEYLQYQMTLKEHFPEDKKTENAIEPDILKMHLLNLKNAAGEMDVDIMDAVMEELSQYEFSGKELSYFETLQTAVEELDSETCTEIVDVWNDNLS